MTFGISRIPHDWLCGRRPAASAGVLVQEYVDFLWRWVTGWMDDFLVTDVLPLTAALAEFAGWQSGLLAS